MGEWKYIDSIKELSDFDNAHCDTRDFHMITNKSDNMPFEELDKAIKNETLVEQCSFEKSEIIPLLKSLEIASGGKGGWRHLVVDSLGYWWLKYIRFHKVKDKYFCYTTIADNVIPLYREKLKPEFVNQKEENRAYK